MKRNIFLCLFVFLAAVSSAQKQITILYTNDTHSCIMPLNKHLADTMLAGRGGFLRRIEMLKQERKQTPDLLLFDSGDFSQGSPYYTLYKGDVEIELMNMMNYDAATIGNHEFDFGIDNMARIFKKAKFPIVCANYDFNGTPLEGIVKPYVIIKRKGIKIGIFGLGTKLDGLVELENCKGVKYYDPVKTAQDITDELRNKKKCDYIICLSHLGWDERDMNDQIMIKNTNGIDLLLGGHSHTYFKKLRYVKNRNDVETPIDQNGKHAIFVGKILLDFKKK